MEILLVFVAGVVTGIVFWNWYFFRGER